MALIIGVFDLFGSILISLFGDRVGKRNTLLIGIAMSFVTFALLPTLNTGLQSAVVGLLLTRLSFEIAFVGHITHATEQAPERRGRYMTLGAAASLICTSFTGLTSLTAYEQWGIAGLSYVGLPFFVISTAIILLFVNERGSPEVLVEA